MSVAVLVPTLDREDKIQSLAANIRATSLTQAQVVPYFIMEEWDHVSQREVMRAGAIGIVGEFGSCATAFNAGFEAAAADGHSFVFTGNDDLVFAEDWLKEALQVADKDHHIIGTNDGHGLMTSFALVRVAYIQEHSGIYDISETLCYPYKSQYVDTELAEYAKHRGVWAEAPKSITRHYHWLYGEADQEHPNYQKALATAEEDKATFYKRKAEWEQT